MPYSASNQNAASSTASNPRRTSRTRVRESADRRPRPRVFLHGARRVPHRRAEAHRPRAQLHAYISASRPERWTLFVQLQVINLFNQFQLCGCGASVFLNGGASRTSSSTTTIRTNVTNSATVSAVQSVHDDAGRGRALGQGTELRQGGQPLRLHDAADVPADVRRAVLGNQVSASDFSAGTTSGSARRQVNAGGADEAPPVFAAVVS